MTCTPCAGNWRTTGTPRPRNLEHTATPTGDAADRIMPFSPILATLAYVFSPDREQVLLIHRNTRPEDPHFGKYNGLGGKLDPSEDVVAGLRREVREEAGIECNQLHLAGTISWPGFGRQGEDWFGFIF